MRVWISGSRTSAACRRLRSLIAAIERAPRVRFHALRVRHEQDRLTAGSKLDALVSGREEAAAPARLATVRIVLARQEHHERRQVRVLAQAVTEPRTQAGTADHLVAGVHEDLRRRVVELRRLHRADERDLVGELRQIREAARRSRLPDWPCRLNWNGDASSFGVPLMNANRSPLISSSGMSWPSCFVSAGLDRTDRAAKALPP